MSTRPNIVRRARSGQTLIVAVAVLFILLVIGALFITQIARNLAFAGRSRDTQLADALAKAGIQFCDRQLTNSEEGADWRPAPTPPIVSLKDPMGVSDPDYEWLSVGFTRMSMKGGRALVRLTYDPHPDDPHSQFIKIESVGRPGELGSTIDPTVFVQSGAAPRLRRELIAYKQLALTDYLRFFTDLDKTHKPASLGVPNIGHYAAMALNDPTTALHADGMNTGELIIGGGIRCNTDLQLLGDVFFYASTRGTSDPTLTFEGMQVAGNILLGPTRDVNGDGVENNNDLMVYINHQINDTNIMTNPASIAGDAIRASVDPLFSTHSGLVRDGSSQPDALGYIRSIPRLDPPSIDTYVNGTGVLRYRALTRDSGAWVNSGTTHYNTGFNGWGTGVYVNNPADLQQETVIPGTGGGYSLPRDWTNPQAGYSSPNPAWQGPHYVSPGLLIDLRGDRLVLTRDDHQPFTHPDGSPITQQGGAAAETVVVPLADADRANWTFPDGAVYALPLLSHDGDDPQFHPTAGQPYGDPNSYGVNIVIFTEGNVRVRGFYGAITDSRNITIPHLGRVHITIVTGGTAYIEGNIVKNDGYLDTNGNMIMERNSTCAILAHDYVCVNPTMFMVAQNLGTSWQTANGTTDQWFMEVGQAPVQQYDAGFSWGVNPNTYAYTDVVGITPTAPYLMLRHTAHNSGPSYLELELNPALNNPITNNAFYPFPAPDTGPPEAQTTYPLGYIYEGGQWLQDQAAENNKFDQQGFTLDFSQYAVQTGIPNPGFDNILRFELNPQPTPIPAASGQSDYLFATAMVAPLDIRIEALLYAEHRSFFVIPGYYANPEPTDSRQNFLKGSPSNTRYAYNAQDATDTADKFRKDLYPFAYEPMDVRITIYGAVAENYTASQGDQTEWLEHWGYIPATYGSTFADATAQYVPDDHLHVHDPAGYDPPEDRSQDFRTPFESQPAGVTIPTPYKDFEITRGLRFVYDPAFAMPYQHPTDPNLSGVTNATRPLRALRFIDRPAVVINNTTVLPEIRQVLPPLPRLPVCPGLLYYGESDRPIT